MKMQLLNIVVRFLFAWGTFVFALQVLQLIKFLNE
jgi:cbb3-type cytochrome oxidase subunit 3